MKEAPATTARSVAVTAKALSSVNGFSSETEDDGDRGSARFDRGQQSEPPGGGGGRGMGQDGRQLEGARRGVKLPQRRRQRRKHRRFRAHLHQGLRLRVIVGPRTGGRRATCKPEVRRLEDRLPKFKQIVFHEKLGTQWERIERIERLADVIFLCGLTGITLVATLFAYEVI